MTHHAPSNQVIISFTCVVRPSVCYAGKKHATTPQTGPGGSPLFALNVYSLLAHQVQRSKVVISFDDGVRTSVCLSVLTSVTMYKCVHASNISKQTNDRLCRWAWWVTEFARLVLIFLRVRSLVVPELPRQALVEWHVIAALEKDEDVLGELTKYWFIILTSHISNVKYNMTYRKSMICTFKW